MQQFDPAFFKLFQKTKERNLFRLTKRFHLLLIGRGESLLAAHGFPDFKIAHFGFLANLDLDGTTSTELATRICISKQAISKMTKEIERLGYIEFQPHETDGRAAVIHLTGLGEKLLRAGMEVGKIVNQEMIAKVGEKAFEQMIDTLKMLLDGDSLYVLPVKKDKKA